MRFYEFAPTRSIRARWTLQRGHGQVMERHIAVREFLVGDRIAVGDFVLAYTLDWAQEAASLGAAFPALEAYVERM